MYRLLTLRYGATEPKDKISSVPLCMFDKIVGDQSKATTRLLYFSWRSSTNSKEVHTTCLAFMSFTESYSGTHFLYRVPYSYFLHLFAPLLDRECLPFPPCPKITVDGPVAGRNGFLRGCTHCGVWVYLNMSTWGGGGGQWELTVYGSWERGGTGATCIHHQVCKCHTRHRTITKKQRNAKRKAFPSVVTQELNQETGNNAREVILINKNVVVSCLAWWQ